MQLRLEYGADRNPDPILAALTGTGVELDEVATRTTWPDDIELQASGDLDFHRLLRAMKALVAAVCPEEVQVSVRVVISQHVPDLLFGIPCDDADRAIEGVPHDIRTYTDEGDPFRSWFRGRWMGSDEEFRLTAQELSSAPLTGARILEFLDPPVSRDWRPIQHYIERHATCGQLVEAIATAKTPTQKWRLAYAFNRRGRSCEAAIPLLIGWLDDADRQVRQEAADSLGRVVLAIPRQGGRVLWGQRAGAALLAYVIEHSDDNLYFAHTALGATGYEPARPYLERLALSGSGWRRESAERGLANLNEGVVKGGRAISRGAAATSRK